jgi:hypothetical protein
MAKLTPGKLREERAKVVLEVFGLDALERYEVHFELGVVRSPGVLGELVSPDARGNDPYTRIGLQCRRHLAATAAASR